MSSASASSVLFRRSLALASLPRSGVTAATSALSRYTTAPQPARMFSSCLRSCDKADSRKEDPGGVPNDGRYPTVYDDFYNITSAPGPPSASGGMGNLIQGSGAMQIASMDDQSFTLDDGLVLTCPIMLLGGAGGEKGSGGADGMGGGGGVTVLMWDAPALEGVVLPNGKGWEEWVREQGAVWKALELVQPRPEILLFGTGKTVLPIPQNIKSYLNSLGVQVDVQNTRAACSTFNLLIEEGRRVGAALLPNVRRPMPRG
ncbi:unnamed protein product [Tilletia controversa]|uniref:NADH dehydrogenase [ubiquinone] 1 alpha subcomplex assembly factor 3 n=3 Tax=Tilletia TaxID=13289 RepID=A0A8X7MXG7_9BASI|nr:hypothetical protein CF336_g3434 [Tilletia laevis]KAE8203884.1 hypothetical protein CF328_g1395 [Tilletia controversa]KAE8262197.1 hypothetical protein A4X03_0g2644 [Tilletia caries]KAE8204761.1 hypothetical protein CF335_g2535 [Tilletia laevis]KAE8252883.1 hypothetical protein A4X06_0g1852 [Tilletia controversa]